MPSRSILLDVTIRTEWINNYFVLLLCLVEVIDVVPGIEECIEHNATEVVDVVVLPMSMDLTTSRIRSKFF